MPESTDTMQTILHAVSLQNIFMGNRSLYNLSTGQNVETKIPDVQ